MKSRATLSICVRARVAALAVVAEGRVIEVYRRFFCSTPKHLSRAEHLANLVRRIRRKHEISSFRVEPDSLGAEAIELLELPAEIVTIDEVKEYFGRGSERSHTPLYERVLAQQPHLMCFVRVLKTGRIAANDDERSRTIVLLAAAIGIAPAN
jgi:hypothetical protein